MAKGISGLRVVNWVVWSVSLATTSTRVVAIWSAAAVSKVLSPKEMEPELSDSRLSQAEEGG